MRVTKFHDRPLYGDVYVQDDERPSRALRLWHRLTGHAMYADPRSGDICTCPCGVTASFMRDRWEPLAATITFREEWKP